MKVIAVGVVLIGLFTTDVFAMAKVCFSDEKPHLARLRNIRDHFEDISRDARGVGRDFVNAFELDGIPSRPHASQILLFNPERGTIPPVENFQHSGWNIYLESTPSTPLTLTLHTPSTVHHAGSRTMRNLKVAAVPKELQTQVKERSGGDSIPTANVRVWSFFQALEQAGVRNLPHNIVELETGFINVDYIPGALGRELAEREFNGAKSYPSSYYRDYGIVLNRRQRSIEVVVAYAINLDKVPPTHVVQVIKAAAKAFVR